jgi:Fungal specific transcription factor domain
MGDYESRKMYFRRSWSISGRAIRLCQMIGLHRLDEDDGLVVRSLSSNEWIDLEERRRIFWTAFCSDRYSGAVTGWPMVIDEKDVYAAEPTFSTFALLMAYRFSPTFPVRKRHLKRVKWSPQCHYHQQ